MGQAQANRTAARVRALRLLRAVRQSCIGMNVARTDAGAAVARGRRSLVAEPAQPDRAANAGAAQVARAARQRALPRAPARQVLGGSAAPSAGGHARARLRVRARQ